jgi:hypothetical protein
VPACQLLDIYFNTSGLQTTREVGREHRPTEKSPFQVLNSRHLQHSSHALSISAKPPNCSDSSKLTRTQLAKRLEPSLPMLATAASAT